MKTKSFQPSIPMIIAIGILGPLDAEANCDHRTYYFVGTVSVNWGTVANWRTDGCSGSTTPSSLPTSANDAVICTLCEVDISTAQCRNLTVQAGIGWLKILTGKKLTVSGAVDADDEIIIEGTGTLDIDACGCSDIASGVRISLESNNSTLEFSASHFVQGSGAIDGLADGAKIRIDSGVTLVSEVDITGNLKITGAGNFINAGRVQADNAGTLEIDVTGHVDDLANNGAVTDQAGGANYRWAVVDSASANLLFDAEPGALAGHFFVELGDLRAGDDAGGGDDVDVLTTGDLLMVSGDIITGAADSFCFSRGCPD